MKHNLGLLAYPLLVYYIWKFAFKALILRQYIAIITIQAISIFTNSTIFYRRAKTLN